MAYLKLWIKGEEEGLSCAIKAITDFKGLRCQRTKHLEKNQNENNLCFDSVATCQDFPISFNIPLYYCHVELKSAYLAIAVLNNHEHWGVLALHGSVQCLNAHAML